MINALFYTWSFVTVIPFKTRMVIMKLGRKWITDGTFSYWRIFCPFSHCILYQMVVPKYYIFMLIYMKSIKWDSTLCILKYYLKKMLSTAYGQNICDKRFLGENVKITIVCSSFGLEYWVFFPFSLKKLHRCLSSNGTHFYS